MGWRRSYLVSVAWRLTHYTARIHEVPLIQMTWGGTSSQWQTTPLVSWWNFIFFVVLWGVLHVNDIGRLCGWRV